MEKQTHAQRARKLIQQRAFLNSNGRLVITEDSLLDALKELMPFYVDSTREYYHIGFNDGTKADIGKTVLVSVTL